MSPSASLRLSILLALAVLPMSCGSSSSSGNSGGTGGSGDDITVNFSGPQSASPISSTKVVISWLDASNSAGDPASSMSYKVYRSSSLTLSDETLIGTTSPGVTSYVDTGLSGSGGQTHFYRVIASDVYGNLSVNTNVVSAHPPANVTSGSIDYTDDILPLFSLEGTVNLPGPGPAALINCLDCHAPGSTILQAEADYSSYDGLVIGTGTTGSPDTWLSPGDGSSTAADFLNRFWTYPGSPVDAAVAHGSPAGAGYDTKTAELQTFANNLSDWANEGGLPAVDNARPVMDFTDIGNTTYEATYDLGNDEVTIDTFHASDPESQAGWTNDQLMYRVYGGLTSNTIDWDTPLVETDRNIYPMDSDISITFSYTGATGVFVVRAVDFEGNETLNEAELQVSR